MTPEPGHPEPWRAQAPAQGPGLPEDELEQVGGLCQQVLGCLARIKADRQELHLVLCQLRAALRDLPERPEVLANPPPRIEAPRPEPLPVAGRPASPGPEPAPVQAAPGPTAGAQADLDAVLRAEFPEEEPGQPSIEPAGPRTSPVRLEAPPPDYDSLLESEFGPLAAPANGSQPAAEAPDYDSLLESEFGPPPAPGPAPSEVEAPRPAGPPDLDQVLSGPPAGGVAAPQEAPAPDVAPEDALPPWARPAGSRAPSPVWPQPAAEAPDPEESVSASREFLASAAALGQPEQAPAPPAAGSDLLGAGGGLSRDDYLAYSRRETEGSAQSVGDGPMPWDLEQAPEDAFFSPQEISDDFFARASFRRRRR
ncbi:MAG TPA: hypothetical protein VKY15_02240 [Acidimicrobiales bacterium]|nr:hypothetical protein [Acidimicrobiales bacterium]